MSTLTLTYFGFEGRAQWQRLALIISGIEFNDVRLSSEEFGRMKAAGELPFGQVPVLDINGRRIGQANAIARYIGKLGGLYPTDAFEALLVDEILDEVSNVIDIAVPLVLRPFTAEEKEAEQERLVEGEFSRHLGCLERKLQINGTGYFSGSQLTLADLAVFSMFRWPTFPGNDWRAIPAKLRTRFPLLSAHFDMAAVASLAGAVRAAT